ncbi:MAG TPA: glycosyltransferase family 39 protein, partial [Anaerolineae bacterium]
MRRSTLLWIALGCLLGLTILGIWPGGLLQQEIWQGPGLERLLLLAGAVTLWFGGWTLIRPAWIPPATLALAIAYTAFAVGALPLLAAGFILLSCFILGSLLWARSENAKSLTTDLLRTLLGLSIYMWLTGLLVHFPVNYPATYLVLLLIPFGIRPARTRECLRTALAIFQPRTWKQRREYAMLAVAALPLLAHWLVTLKPEASADGLAVHLAIPMSVANHHLWAFDFRNIVWAVMPMGADWCYTIAVLLGGEFAARLLNLGMFLIICALLYDAARRWVSRPAALLAVALFGSSPLVQLVTGSMFVENFWGALLFGALAALWTYRETKDRALVVVIPVLCGAAVMNKLGALTFAIPTLALLVWELRRLRKQAAICAGLFLLVASQPYLNAWVLTGNPLFPFLNTVFRSPWFDTTKAFVDARFHEPLSLHLPYDVTFRSHLFFEGQDGSLGFHYLLLAPLCLLLWRKNWSYREWTCLAVPLGFVLLTFSSQPNLRYVYPALPFFVLLIVTVLRDSKDIAQRFYSTVWVAALACFVLNIYFLPTSNWHHKEFFLNAFNKVELEAYTTRSTPVRKLVAYMNEHHPGEPVGFLESAQVAGLRGRAYTNTWHHDKYFKQLRAINSPLETLKLAREFHLRYFILPKQDSGVVVIETAPRLFLDEFAKPESECGAYYIAALPADYLSSSPETFSEAKW